jgi:carboxymethylenebutenolidase
MALNDYLAEEIVQDCADGILSRREALRRLVLLGISIPLAGSYLAACSDDDDASTVGSAGSSAPPATSASAAPSVEAELIHFAGASGELQAAFAGAAETPKGALLVIHENRGLTPHFHDVVGRFAKEGYSSLCVDLVSPEGGTASLDEGAVQAALGGAPLDRLVADLRSGIDEVMRRTPGVKVGTVGFCFGGGMVWNLLNAGEDRLAAAVPFYGPAPDAPDFTKAKAAVLAIYGELDARVNATRDKAEAALTAAGLTHDVRTFAGADHAFFNDTGPRYNPTAAAEAFTLVLDWFRQHLA